MITDLRLWAVVSIVNTINHHQESPCLFRNGCQVSSGWKNCYLFRAPFYLVFTGRLSVMHTTTIGRRNLPREKCLSKFGRPPLTATKCLTEKQQPPPPLRPRNKGWNPSSPFHCSSLRRLRCTLDMFKIFYECESLKCLFIRINDVMPVKIIT